jgi:glycosyltransferase involved in cell wall biosynthesis
MAASPPTRNERTGTPDVSVVIPTHNRSLLLPLTLRSVLWQRDVDLEVIVVDDHSEDDTFEFLRRVGDPRVRVFRHDAWRGVSAARNHGIQEARGRWVAFLDDDDLWSPQKLTWQLDAVRESRRKWAYGGTVEISVDNRVFDGRPPFTPEEVMEGVATRNLVHAGSSNVIVERDWLPRPAFDGRLHHSPDWDLWIRLARQGPPACVQRPLLAYRLHPGNESLDMEGMFAEVDEIERRYGGPVDRSQYFRYLGTLSLKTGWNREAIRFYRRALKASGGNYARTAFVLDVWEVLTEALRARLAPVGIRIPSLRWRGDVHGAWKAEAQAWIDQLIREEPVSLARP